ncbi:dihydropyrimidinase [Telmatospirillum siberiense]|uniref:Dihydropyrimidinase n=1 Tax=Telmatospirillum siberiense TaxID=382514 RepID=A0A2N3Q0U2_9PROT|nr:dihydropyrimidinase [Telmatospirillum siberiense]PKU26264.1 dihydropyrimidinase [Telmatospirillum siberiense]
MTEFDLTIRGATVVAGGDVVACDIGIHDGRIQALAEHLPAGRRDIDGRGRLVLPGGVDGHCHFDQPTMDGSRMADDFLTGTRSAAFGGTTTVIPFACQMKGRGLRAAVDDYHLRAAGKAVIDYAFHLIVSDPTPEVLANELPALIDEGYTSFKIYTTYDDLKLDDRQILDVLSVARDHGAMVMVHAENADCIAWLTERLEGQGKTAPGYHAASRPAVVEREATHRVIAFSELVDVPILIVHVSGADAMRQIRWGQDRGLRIYAETCPQYLFLTADNLAAPGFEGAKCICSPPPRDAGNQQAIWDGLAGGVFQIFSSDHAPFRYADPQGKQVHGEKAAFRYVPNGIPGVETRLPLLFSGGVREGRISLPQFVELTATNPAKMYGLYPRKGTIAVGADADLALWDPQVEVVISNDKLHHAVDYTPYEGITVHGWPMTVISRGEVVCDGGELLAQPGQGRFLRCGLPRPAMPKSARPLFDGDLGRLF